MRKTGVAVRNGVKGDNETFADEKERLPEKTAMKFQEVDRR
jgi:hypothetical protein